MKLGKIRGSHSRRRAGSGFHVFHTRPQDCSASRVSFLRPRRACSPHGQLGLLHGQCLIIVFYRINAFSMLRHRAALNLVLLRPPQLLPARSRARTPRLWYELAQSTRNPPPIYFASRTPCPKLLSSASATRIFACSARHDTWANPSRPAARTPAHEAPPSSSSGGPPYL